jgi:hypothetical protein
MKKSKFTDEQIAFALKLDDERLEQPGLLRRVASDPVAQIIRGRVSDPG